MPTSVSEIWYYSRTSNDIDMKLGPVPQLDKIKKQHHQKKKKKKKKNDDKVVSANYDVIIIFPIDGWFGFWNQDYGSIFYNFYIFINDNLLSYKNWKQNWKISASALILLLWVKSSSKNANFLQKMLSSAKLRGFCLVLKGIFSETKYLGVLTCEISHF